MKYPTKDEFQKTLRNWGVNNDSTILIYDDSGSALASRLYYLLELYGFNMNNVKILNGGIKEWTSFEEITKEKTIVKTKGNVTLKEANKDLFVQWMDVYEQIASRNPNVILLDSRPHEMYTGKKMKGSVRAGHIPGAINIVSMKGIKAQYWISDDKLKQIYKNLPKDKTIYVYCHDGFRMSLAYLQLKKLGYKHVKLYNGGWADWGNKLSLPILKGDKPYSGDYDL